MRIRFEIEFFSHGLGSAGLFSDDFESKSEFEFSNIPFKNNRNQLIFGDFLQNEQGFIGFIYQVNGYIDFDLILPQFEISNCNNFFLDNLCKNCNQEECIEECCNDSKSTKSRRYLAYMTLNDTNFTVTSCPTYYYLVNGNQCA